MGRYPRQGVVAQGDRMVPGAGHRLVGRIAELALGGDFAVGAVVEGFFGIEVFKSDLDLIEVVAEVVRGDVGMVGFAERQRLVLQRGLGNQHEQAFQQVLQGHQPGQAAGVVGPLEPGEVLDHRLQPGDPLGACGHPSGFLPVEAFVFNEKAAKIGQQTGIGGLDAVVLLGINVGVAAGGDRDFGPQSHRIDEAVFEQLALPGGPQRPWAPGQRVKADGIQHAPRLENGPGVAAGQVADQRNRALMALVIVRRRGSHQRQEAVHADWVGGLRGGRHRWLQ